MTLTLEKAKELLEEIPEDVQNDPRYQKKFLDLLGDLFDVVGEEWVKEHRVMLSSQWECFLTRV